MCCGVKNSLSCTDFHKQTGRCSRRRWDIPRRPPNLQRQVDVHPKSRCIHLLLRKPERCCNMRHNGGIPLRRFLCPRSRGKRKSPSALSPSRSNMSFPTPYILTHRPNSSSKSEQDVPVLQRVLPPPPSPSPQARRNSSPLTYRLSSQLLNALPCGLSRLLALDPTGRVHGGSAG